MDEKKQDLTPIEEQLEAMLVEGNMVAEDKSEGARRRIMPRTEIRIQTSHDPIVKETKLYRSLAQEVDGRYDEYMKRAETQQEE